MWLLCEILPCPPWPGFKGNLKFFGTTLTIGWLLLSVNETTILGTLLIIANITSVSFVTFVTFLATLKMIITLVRASVLPFEECVAALHWSNVSNRSSAALGETLLGRWRRGNVWSKWEWGGLFDDHRDKKKGSTGVLKVWFLQKNIYLAASPPAHPKSFSGGN